MRLILLLLLLFSRDGLSKVVFERLPEGRLQPQASVDAQGTLHLVYMNGKPDASDIWYVHRGPGEVKFSQPLRVNSKPGNAIAMGTIRGARMAVGRTGRVYVVWNG